ncbi:bifunctional hydroxymethylpyrimidine kinase/phosphomethylpyrimidine kinase [bacterium]|nr:bifunctional hydroxymethylpyrimidine kinase/phosphomethylpyrimidine kinase [bacterium]
MKRKGKKRDKLKVAVFGSMNTDIIAYGVKRFLNPGEQTVGGVLKIGPGGKSRNIAQMISVLLGKGKVAMVSKTVKDNFNLWKVPLDALKKYGVITDFIKVAEFKKEEKFPGIAIIPVDRKGRNQIYVLPGINEEFSRKDIDDVTSLFDILKTNQGIIVLTFEMPYETSLYIVEKAKKYGIKVMIDPGGIEKGKKYRKLLKGCYFLKPNEFEAEILTGIKVNNFKTAKLAGNKLLDYGIDNVLITCGKKGGYFFSKGIYEYIKVPDLKIKSEYRDETGCGDQVSAAVVYGIVKRKNIFETVKEAILAGCLQFYKRGINPVKKSEIKEALRRIK